MCFLRFLLLVILPLHDRLKNIVFYALPPINVIKCSHFGLIKAEILTLGAVLTATVRSDLIPQMFHCDLQVECKFSGIYWLTPIKCPNTSQSLVRQADINVFQ